MEEESRIKYVVEHTEVLRAPKQRLATFGISNIYYYLVTEPVYLELTPSNQETVVREGEIIARRPKIVTPYYLLNLFQGFEHGQEYAEYILKTYGPNEPGLLYQYQNKPREANIVSAPLEAVVETLNQQIDQQGNLLAAIIRGVDEMWDISLMKFIHDLTRLSLKKNILELDQRGLLDIDHEGIPQEARLTIERLFRQAELSRAKIAELEIELRRWGLFEEYQDRFLSLFRKR
jgi:hypothetical protein